jgi:hypothetical protein
MPTPNEPGFSRVTEKEHKLRRRDHRADAETDGADRRPKQHIDADEDGQDPPDRNTLAESGQ